MRPKALLSIVSMLLLWSAVKFTAFAGEISGTVFGTDGQTPQGDTVVLLSSSDEALRIRFGLPRITNANKDGRFKFDGLVAGVYTVRALHEQSGTIATSQTRLTSDAAHVGVWLTLRPIQTQDGATLWGMVKSRDGTIRVDTQVVYRKAGEDEWHQAPVDEFGMYFVRRLDEGEYEVAALSGRVVRAPEPLRRLLTTSIKPQRVTVQRDALLRVDLTAMQLIPELGNAEVFLRGAVKLCIEGRLVDEDEKPLARVAFTVVGLRAQFRGKGGGQFATAIGFKVRAETDGEGKFAVTVGDPGLRIRMLKALGAFEGEVTLTIQVEGYAPTVVRLQNEAVEQLLKLAGEEIKVDVGQVVVTRGVTLKVRVVSTATGEPIADARVLLSLSELNPKVAELHMRLIERIEMGAGKGIAKRALADRWQFFSTTDEDGYATFEALPLTTFHVYAIAEGYEVAHQRVELLQRAQPAEVTIELKRHSTLQKKRTKQQAAEV